MNPQINQQLIKLLQDGKEIPTSFKNVLFPEKRKMECELSYGIKQREEDILADTWSVPFQPVKKFGNIKNGEWHNQLIFGDNLQVLKHIKKLQDQGKMEKIKLVFIDPPFGTGDIYDAKGAPAYSAALQGTEFLEFLRKRLIFLREILADDGSIYVRIDYHFGHYVKVLMDEIFGKNNFQAEIVLNRFKKKSGAFTTTTESLFFYSKSIYPNFLFNSIQRPRQCTFCKKLLEPKWQWMSSAGKSNNPKYFIVDGKRILLYPPKGRHWTNSQEKIDELQKEGKIRIDKSISYTDTEGKKINFVPERLQDEDLEVDNNWTDIPGYVFGVFTEGTYGIKYPTQNAEEVLERVIKASTNKGDLILDCFAGSGTTGAVAEKLGRRWIMADVGKLSIYTILKRMHYLKEQIGNKGKLLKPKPFVLYNAGLYFDEGYLKDIDKEDYKNFALELFQAEEKEQIINGFKLEGVLMNAPVHIFPRDGSLTEKYIDDLHKTIGNYLRERMFIIAPLNRVYFLQDYIEKDGIRYYILRIPYSIIDELHKNNFSRPIQAATDKDINNLIDAVGFDFINPPEVEANYYKTKSGGLGLFEELVIDIKKFQTVQRSKKPVEFKDKEALSMVLVDQDYNGKYFDMDHYFFQDEIKKNNWKVRFSAEKAKKQIAIIYLDVLGNERFEVKNIKDFKRK